MDNQSEGHEQQITPPTPFGQYELSPIERNALRNSIDVYINTSDPLTRINDEAHEKAIRDILRVGRRGLPMLKEELYDNEDNQSPYNEFANFVNVLAEKEDTAFVQHLLIDSLENRPENSSSKALLISTLLHQILEIRDTDPHDPRLHDIAMSLGSAVISSDEANIHVRGMAGMAVISTGDAWIEDFMADFIHVIPDHVYEEVQRYKNEPSLIGKDDLIDDDWKRKLQEAREHSSDEIQEHVELTDEEKEIILHNLHVFNDTEHSFDATRRNEDSVVEILKFKNRSLPYLKEILLDTPGSGVRSPGYKFSRIASTVAGRQDIPLLLEAISDPAIVRNRDLSSLSTLSSLLRRLSVQIRIEDPADPNLELIASKLVHLIEISEGTELHNQPSGIYRTIAATGTDHASEYLRSESRVDQAALDNVSDITTIPYITGNTNSFAADLLRRAGIESEGRSITMPWEVTQTGYSYSGLSEYAQNGRSLESTTHHQETQDNYDDSDDENNAVFEIDPYDSEIVKEKKRICLMAQTVTEKLDEQIELPLPFRAVVALHAYNLLVENPEYTEEQVMHDVKKLHSGIENEKRFKELEILPTIGIEVEIPNKFFPIHLFEDNMEEYEPVHNLLDMNDLLLKRDGNVNEFVFTPSFHARTQNAILLELRKAGFIPTDTAEFASMHVNIGQKMTAESIKELGYRDRALDTGEWYEIANTADQHIALAASDLLTYAFVPAGRIRSRENNNAVHLDTRTQLPVQHTSESSIEISPEKYMRYEFRTPRVIGAKTYRMLQEFQEIGVLLINNDSRLDSIKKDFFNSVQTLRAYYDLNVNAPERNQEEAARKVKLAWDQKQGEIAAEKLAVLEITDPEEAAQMKKQMRTDREPNLIDDARSLMWYFAREIRKTLVDAELTLVDQEDYDYVPMAAD